MIIRKATLRDFNEFYKLLNEIPELQGGVEKEGSYSMSWIRGTLKNKERNLSLVAEDNNKIVGFLLAELWKDKKDSFFVDIYVKPEYRRKGIAKKLKNEYEKVCKNLGIKFITAIVLTNNKRMQSIIEKIGYKRGDTFYFYRKELK